MENLMNNGVSVCRTARMSDARYIAALETANKALNRENRRLVRRLHERIYVININTARQ